ncbi:PD-(D/E)XK nuclease family protein [Patescibacteria group bacterium]
MNKYKQRQKNLYSSSAQTPFKLSRSKVDMFMQCPRCFYLDRRLGLGRPSMPGWALNSAVDQLLKNEFDLLRKKGQTHELMKQYKIDAIPFTHPDIEEWRNNFVGKQYLHEGTNLLIFGAVDDVWINKKDELLIVDYKATSTSKEISLEDEYKQGYKRQMEIYQWIFRQSGFKVSPVGYFVFANAGKNRLKFDARLEFELSIVLHKGDDSWVEPTVYAMKKCLDSGSIPKAGEKCEYCQYRKLMKKEEG